MELKFVYDLVNKEIRENYISKSELARVMKINRQNLNDLLNRLKNNKGITFQRLQELLSFFNYEIILIKKENEEF